MEPRIGDEIYLKLSGDCIPYGYYDSGCKRGTGPKIKLPTHCECGATLIEENNRLRCPNAKCPYRISGMLVTFFKELNAKGIGAKTCIQLHDELGIAKPSQVLKLKYEDFLTLTGVKDGSARIYMDTINDILTKPRSAASIISALGLDSLRTSTAEKLLKVVNNDHELLIGILKSKSPVTIRSIIASADGIDTNASKIASDLLDNLEELEELFKLIPIKQVKDKSNLTKSILISGFRNDENFIEVANKAGFDVKDSGSKYDILVIKDESMMGASKAQFALAHNREIMTRSEFLKKFG